MPVPASECHFENTQIRPRGLAAAHGEERKPDSGDEGDRATKRDQLRARVMFREVPQQTLVASDHDLRTGPLLERGSAEVLEDCIVHICDLSASRETADEVDVFEPEEEAFVEAADGVEVASSTTQTCARRLSVYALGLREVEVEHRFAARDGVPRPE